MELSQSYVNPASSHFHLLKRLVCHIIFYFEGCVWFNISDSTVLYSKCPTIASNSMGPRRHQDDVIKWKHFPRYWPLARGIHRSPVNSPRKGQWRGALRPVTRSFDVCFIHAWTNGWVNNRDAGDLRRHLDHYVVTVIGRNFASVFFKHDSRLHILHIYWLGIYVTIWRYQATINEPLDPPWSKHQIVTTT